MESGLWNQIESEIFNEKHWQTRVDSSRKLPKRRQATLTIIGIEKLLCRTWLDI
jgi:hypothetical protein